MSRFIRLRGLPWSVTNQEILDFLKDVNVVNGPKGISLVTNRWDGKNTGEAFVELEGPEDEEEAFKHNKETLGHRYIEIFSASNEEAEHAVKKPNSSSHVVKLRGLPYAITEDMIEDFFNGLEIKLDREGILIVMDRRGRASGEAYVQFETPDDTEQALKRNREKIGHRYIEIFRSSVAEMRRQSSNRPGPYDKKDRGGPRGGNSGRNDFGGGGSRGVRGGSGGPRDSWSNNYGGRDGGGNFGNRDGGFSGSRDSGGGSGSFNNGNGGNRYNNNSSGGNGGYGNNGNNSGFGDFNNFGNSRSSNFNGGNGNGGNNSFDGAPFSRNSGGNNNNSSSGGGSGGSGFGNNFNFNSGNDNNRSGGSGGGGGGGSVSGGGGGGSGGNGGGGSNSSVSGGFGPVGGGRNDNDLFCVHMRGLPYNCFETEVTKFFDPVRPTTIKVIFNNKGLHSGSADALFETHDDAVLAMKKHREQMGNRYIELFFDGKSRGNNNNFSRRI